MNSQNKFRYFNTGSNSIVGLIFIVIFFIALFYLAKGVFTLLSWAAPVFLLLALIINYRVVFGYIKWIWETLTTNVLRGIVLVLLTVFGFPFVAIYLFMKAWGLRSMANMQNQMQDQIKYNEQFNNQQNHTSKDGDFSDYEILGETTDSSNQKSTSEKKSDNPYDTEFE